MQDLGEGAHEQGADLLRRRTLRKLPDMLASFSDSTSVFLELPHEASLQLLCSVPGNSHSHPKEPSV